MVSISLHLVKRQKGPLRLAYGEETVVIQYIGDGGVPKGDIMTNDMTGHICLRGAIVAMTTILLMSRH